MNAIVIFIIITMFINAFIMQHPFPPIKINIYRMYTPDGLLLRIFLVSSLALSVPCMTDSTHSNYMAFLVFEVCVGIYFPAMGTMKV
jgi:hypothetical protein